MGTAKFKAGDRVIATNDEEYPGTITEHFPEEHGDFEYHVQHDDGSSSFWPLESLRAE